VIYLFPTLQLSFSYQVKFSTRGEDEDSPEYSKEEKSDELVMNIPTPHQ